MLEVKFYQTYYFCDIIRNVLHDRFSFIRSLHEFYGDEDIFYLVDPFEKYSSFHQFIQLIVEDIYWEQANNIDLKKRKEIIKGNKSIPESIEFMRPDKLPIELAFEFHSIDYLSFEVYLFDNGKRSEVCDEDDIYDYMNELRLSQEYEDLIQQTVKEVFHVLFQNRVLLLLFNDMMAMVLGDHKDTEIPDDKIDLFSKPGILKRKSIPKWAQRAVFFRDKGRCVLCDKDLSGMLNIENIENYDHIVPLARHGLNDVSNMQLLCQECNQIEKRDGQAETSINYQSWYSYE